VVRLPPRLRPLFPYLKPAYVRGTRMVAPGMQWVSRVRDGFLPTGAVQTLEDAAVTSGGRCTVARPAEILDRPGIEGLPPGLPLTDPTDGEHVDRLAVAELPGGRVLGPHRAVITGRGDLVHEVSRYFGTTRPREHPLFLNPLVPAPLEVDGRLGVLASRGDGNYYHFLFDVLSRIGALEQCRDVAPPDRWYVPATTRFQRELLAMMGVDDAHVIDADRHPHVRAQCLVVPGPPAMNEKNPPWVVEFLRRRLLPQVEVGAANRRIYVTRGAALNNRAVLDEQAVIDFLATRGFEAVDPGAMPVAEQIRTFAEASLIVAPHGAALANLLFASSGAGLIEMFPAGCLLPDFWRMACGVPGLRYRYLSAPGGPARPTRASAIVTDIAVDLAALGRLVDELG
jgi:capsular polysaccharide biosynthesis protein